MKNHVKNTANQIYNKCFPVLCDVVSPLSLQLFEKFTFIALLQQQQILHSHGIIIIIIIIIVRIIPAIIIKIQVLIILHDVLQTPQQSAKEFSKRKAKTIQYH